MNKEETLYKELCYIIQGILFEVKKTYGPGHKEIVYCNAIEELLVINNIPYQREKSIKIVSPRTGKVIGYYKPDFIIDDKIVLEIKAVEIIPRNFIDQIYSYLKVSEYELGLFVNYRSPKLFVKRIIYTNDRKFKNNSSLIS